WADGIVPRSDGLIWICDDFVTSDRTHPSTSGRLKVANLLLNFFKTDTTARGWFLRSTSTEIYKPQSAIPNRFSLEQNYPNPFNPSTTISFTIPHSSFITLKVFDVLGREVATLVNEELRAGRYERTFDGSGLASGVYLLRLQAGSSVQTNKLLLLK
ncbi:MAG: T9SS type A sorting domain-containing protein, partial [Bacteroidota bacterium]